MADDLTEKSTAKKGNRLLNRLFGYSEPETQDAAESEVIKVINMSCEQGLIDKNCKIMIENIFSFDDTSTNEIMTHRKDVVACEDNEPLTEVVQKVIDSGYSRIPVYHEDTDNIVGILYAKDLLRFVFNEIPEDFKLTDITRDAFFVPSSKKCSKLFAEMIAAKTQIAIVVDEYGGTDGIVSLEDLIELIMGNIQDEFDHEELGKVDRSFSETMVGFTLGGDLIANYSITEHAGVFVKVGGRWVAACGVATAVKYEDDDFNRVDTNTDSETGNFSIVPTIGAMWVF